MRILTIAAASSFILLSTTGITTAETASHGGGDSHQAKKEQAHAPKETHQAKKEPGHAPKKAHKEIHWEYSGDSGPKNWGKIKSDYKACRLGKYQSPIDLKATIGADLPALEIDYKPVPLTILNNGHTVQVNYPAGSSMTVDGTVFDLLQFHFHTPSENKINGKTYDMELHFVHKTDDGQLGVLGVMITKGKHNASAQAIWDHLPLHKAGAQTHNSVIIDGSALIPQKLGYYRFMGSLTTPPCTEGVNWHVLANPIEFSATQIKKFKQAFPMNARPVQSVNSRLIVIDD